MQGIVTATGRTGCAGPSGINKGAMLERNRICIRYIPKVSFEIPVIQGCASCLFNAGEYQEGSKSSKQNVRSTEFP